MGKNRTQSFRSQLVTNDNTAGTLTFKLLIKILIFFSACKCDDLCSDICFQLLLAGASFDHIVHAGLILTESDKLKRNKMCIRDSSNFL